jgi:hypothetical protein
MHVQFREFNPFDLWIWLELETVPSEPEKQYLEMLFDSWFFLGKLGAFNAENLPVQEAGLELSYLEYEPSSSSESLMALMHNMGDLEYEGYWARCWFDLGTSDAISLDILINALTQFSQDYVNILSLWIGGENLDWPVPDSHHPSKLFEDSDA